jgi:hypothetical protein
MCVTAQVPVPFHSNALGWPALSTLALPPTHLVGSRAAAPWPQISWCWGIGARALPPPARLLYGTGPQGRARGHPCHPPPLDGGCHSSQSQGPAACRSTWITHGGWQRTSTLSLRLYRPEQESQGSGGVATATSGSSTLETTFRCAHTHSHTPALGLHPLLAVLIVANTLAGLAIQLGLASYPYPGLLGGRLAVPRCQCTACVIATLITTSSSSGTSSSTGPGTTTTTYDRMHRFHNTTSTCAAWVDWGGQAVVRYRGTNGWGTAR